MISILFTYDINHNAHSVSLNYEGENEITGNSPVNLNTGTCHR